MVLSAASVSILEDHLCVARTTRIDEDKVMSDVTFFNCLSVALILAPTVQKSRARFPRDAFSTE